MIHFATVHFGSDRWIDVQLSYLERNIEEPFKVWANLQEVPGNHDAKFDRIIPALGEHPGKLNLIAAEICATSAPDDLIVFLDGDAFPISDPMPLVRKALEETTLVAVRRDENAGDPQPHPSFCAVAVSEWLRIRGDWSNGHCWNTTDGRLATDVGGNLLRSLERLGASWTPLLRSNRINMHPLWFGIYGDVIYHHGSGFRKAVARVDLMESPRLSQRGRYLPLIGRPLRRLNRSRLLRWEARTAAAALKLGDDMYDKLRTDPLFYKELI